MRLSSLIPGVLALCLVLVLITAPGAKAQSDTFSLPSQEQDKEVERDPTGEELDEMQAVYNRCSQRFHSQYMDCRCIAVKFLDQRMRQGQEPPQRILLEKVYDKCPATAAVAGKTYNRCLNWASMMRRDYKSFCECYANHYATTFSKNPSLRPLTQQNMMSSAMSECGYAEPLNERIEQRHAIGSQERPQSEFGTVFGKEGG